MQTPLIDSSRIQSMIEQLKAAASAPSSKPDVTGARAATSVGKPDFASALKSSLDQVNSAQTNADALGQKFALGDDSVNLSDVMIATQKANISFQAAIQVRNKLVSAYHDVLSMQI